jgi:hypothetical protein
MQAVLSSRGFSLVLVAAIGAMPVAPPVHVHETTTPEGHHEALTHRHLSSHVGHVAQLDHDRATLEDADSVVATLDIVFAPPGGGHFPPAPPPTVMVLLRDTVEPIRFGSPEYIERLIHAPPRAPTDVRGPPATPLQ